jgi:hypothetical protein
MLRFVPTCTMASTSSPFNCCRRALTATYWHALRANGVYDRVGGFGRLLEEF